MGGKSMGVSSVYLRDLVTGINLSLDFGSEPRQENQFRGVIISGLLLFFLSSYRQGLVELIKPITDSCQWGTIIALLI